MAPDGNDGTVTHTVGGVAGGAPEPAELIV